MSCNKLEGFLGTVRTTNIAVGAKVCLIGDAAHAITPFFGQGTNAGFEDVGVSGLCSSSLP